MVAFERVAYPMFCRATQNAAHMVKKLFARTTVTLMLVSLCSSPPSSPSIAAS